MTTRIDDIMTKVNALMRLADDPGASPAEAELARSRAEALMFKYKIDSLTEPETFSAIKPIGLEFIIAPYTSKYSLTYRIIARMITEHVGARCMIAYTRPSYDWQITLVGFESDVRYAQMLFHSAALAFGSKMEPKLTDDMSDQVKCYMLRQAGWEGGRVALKLFGEDTKSSRSRVRRLADAEATRRGEPTMAGVDVKAYREAYAHGFVAELRSRLERLRMVRGEQEHGIVLANAREAIDEMFYSLYPNEDPKRWTASPAVRDTAPCEKCAKSKRGACRDHYIPLGRSSRGRAYSYAGAERGRTAAQSVDLGSAGTSRLDTNTRHNEIGG